MVYYTKTSLDGLEDETVQDKITDLSHLQILWLKILELGWIICR